MSSQPPRCHCQRGELALALALELAVSAGSASFTRNARRTTNKRSVNSCAVPVVYSLSRVSTNNGRTFKSSSFWPVALGHLAEIHFPKEMTCGFGTAAHSLHATQSMTNINMTESFRDMIIMKTGTGAEVFAMTSEQGKCSVFSCAGAQVGQPRAAVATQVLVARIPRVWETETMSFTPR